MPGGRGSRSRAVGLKAPTGVPGLDEALRGGLPRGRTTILFGGPGCGKTVLSLQTLVNGARLHDEPGVFVAFEENSRQVVANAASFGWNLQELQRRKLFFLDASLRPGTVQAGKFDLSALLAGLSAKVAELGARRVVFDGIDVLLTLLDDPAAERLELFRVHEWLQANQLTGLITAKAQGADPFSQGHYAFAAYMADCALLLERRHQRLTSERSLTILKYRGSDFTENSCPFALGSGGIEVAEQDPGPRPVRTSRERLSTGVERLDTMLRGGYFRGSSVLITGLPGTAKTSLCGAFVRAACRRQERALFVTFDEHGDETVRNLTSIGIQLRPFLDAGLLRVQSALARSDSSEVQLMRIRRAIQAHRATMVVVDPVSALAKSSDPSTAVGVLSRFFHWCKTRGLTLVFSSLLGANDPYTEGTDLGASTLADTWIHLTYAQNGGERNRGLTIIKSRGTGHSSQVRELVLGDRGITLTDVYESGGEVVMGTLRWEQEARRREEERLRRLEGQRRRLELERGRAELLARQAALQRELALNTLELKVGARSEVDRRQRAVSYREQLLRHRDADRRRAPAPRTRRSSR